MVKHILTVDWKDWNSFWSPSRDKEITLKVLERVAGIALHITGLWHQAFTFPLFLKTKVLLSPTFYFHLTKLESIFVKDNPSRFLVFATSFDKNR